MSEVKGNVSAASAAEAASAATSFEAQPAAAAAETPTVAASFLRAGRRGDVATLQALLRAAESDAARAQLLRATDSDGYTALHKAAYNGRCPAIRLLQAAYVVVGVDAASVCEASPAVERLGNWPPWRRSSDSLLPSLQRRGGGRTDGRRLDAAALCRAVEPGRGSPAAAAGRRRPQRLHQRRPHTAAGGGHAGKGVLEMAEAVWPNQTLATPTLTLCFFPIRLQRECRATCALLLMQKRIRLDMQASGGDNVANGAILVWCGAGVSINHYQLLFLPICSSYRAVLNRRGDLEMLHLADACLSLSPNLQARFAARAKWTVTVE